ncbi:MAG: Crp/Fnr family transcriptional regulator [Clostridia bacterium]|nr:Crp/Fnr family transcriptional regulator [Clostridia bacterium]
MNVSDKLVERLLKLDIFSSLSPQVLKSALSCDETGIVDYRRGEIIYSGDCFRSSVGYIIKGGAKVVKSENSVIISKLSENSLFGCAALFSGKDHFVNEIVATKDTRVFYIDKSVIVKLMQLDTTFPVSYIRYLSDRILFLNKRIVNFTGGSAESRLANYLLSCFADYKTYELDRSMSQLAVSLDIGRASLYRAFDSLESGGAVERNGKYVRLVDKDTLKKFIQ